VKWLYYWLFDVKRTVFHTYKYYQRREREEEERGRGKYYYQKKKKSTRVTSFIKLPQSGYKTQKKLGTQK